MRYMVPKDVLAEGGALALSTCDSGDGEWLIVAAGKLRNSKTTNTLTLQQKR